MKQLLITAVLAAVVAAGISWGTTRWFARGQRIDLHDAGWLRREFQLTPEQTATIAKLTDEYRTAVNTSCAKHCDARFNLSEELAKPTVNLPAAEEAVGKMCAAANAVEQATLQHILKVREILTPEQRTRYAALINQQLCTMYPPAQP
ncbi:MAG: hypothetical protein PCFJNLEI_03606 [Verrucomicrobiae bacterium]|nr:hypothetical protein [Verrucomicrobiae bacterium]